MKISGRERREAIRLKRRTGLDPAMRTLTYLVLDLETTGAHPLKDDIIEVAAIGLDSDMCQLFSYESVLNASTEGMDRMLALAPVVEMHQASGLLEDIKASGLPTLTEVEQALLDLVKPFLPAGFSRPHNVRLSGSGVSHFDASFINEQMPSLGRLLRPSTHDVGVMRIAYRQATGSDLVDANLHKTHRAMDDVRCHLAEMRAFRDLFVNHAASVMPASA